MLQLLRLLDHYEELCYSGGTMKRSIWFIMLLCAVCTAAAVPVKAAPKASARSLYMKVGAQKKLKISGVNGKITWKTSNPDIATVSRKGLVTAKAAGSAKILASFKYRGARKRLYCTVRPCTMKTEPLTVKKGSSASVNIKGTKKEQWKTSDPLVATVSDTGKIRAVQAGTCTITGTIKDVKFKRTIKVSGFKDSAIILSETGKALDIKLKNVTEDIIYTISNESIARVSGEKLLPVGRGTCILTAAAGGELYSVPVIVTEANASQFVDNLETYHQYIKAHSDNFKRSYDSSLKNFEIVQARVALGQTVGLTCVVPCRWALYSQGVRRADGKALITYEKGYGFKRQYNGGVKTALDWIKKGDVIGLTLKEAVDRGLLRKGDIIGYKGKTHTFVYSGEGYYVYEGGSYCVRKGHYPNGIKMHYAKDKLRLEKDKIGEILRWKK